MNRAKLLQRLTGVLEWLQDDLHQSRAPQYHELVDVIIYFLEHPEAIHEPQQ